MQALEEDMRDEPTSALPELADLVERMLADTGYNIHDPVVAEGEEREVVAEFTAARDTADRVERGDAVDPGDIGAAVNGLRAVFDYLVAERSTG